MIGMNVIERSPCVGICKRHVASGSAVISDGLACFRAVKEANCEHLGVVTGGNLDWLIAERPGKVKTLKQHPRKNKTAICIFPRMAIAQ